MHTPAGYAVNEVNQFIPTDWWAVVFNPSFPYRLLHMVLAAYLTTAFVVGGTGAWHLLRKQDNAPARLMVSMALWMAVIVAPLQMLAGDLHGLNTLEHQPVKVAAMEGHYETRSGAPLILFGIPNSDEERIDYALEIPKLGSLILTHDIDGEIRGLKEWAPEDRPPVAPVFFAFRIMVGIGVLMIGVGAIGLLSRLRGRLYQSRWLHRILVAMAPSGFLAVLAGWVVTEVGRQPYTIYGLLRTADSVSPLDAPAVSASLLAFVVVYFAVFGAGVFYLLRLMNSDPQTPKAPAQRPSHAAGITPMQALTPADSREGGH
jgi:cytochrome d ubiquinol oxidase subunit I